MVITECSFLDITKPIIDNEESLLMRANKMQKWLKKRPHFKAEDDTLLVFNNRFTNGNLISQIINLFFSPIPTSFRMHMIFCFL